MDFVYPEDREAAFALFKKKGEPQLPERGQRYVSVIAMARSSGWNYALSPIGTGPK